jgi:hypothetical protein
VGQTDYSVPPSLRHRVDRDATPGWLKDELFALYTDFGYFCKAMFPSRFNMPYTSLHRKIIDTVDNVLAEQQDALSAGKPAGRKVAIKGARGISKTGFTGFALPARNILFGHSKFIAYVTKAEGNSILQTENLREALLATPGVGKKSIIQSIFGDLREQGKRASWESKFGAKAWVMGVPGNRTLVLPRGVGQQLRGLLFDDARPDFLDFDDFDDDKTLMNDELRTWLHDTWFEGAALRCVSQFESENIPYLILFSDTCKHEAAKIEALCNDPSWISVTIPVCDENYQVIDPTFKSQEELDKEITAARANGTISALARELMCIPAAVEDRPFDPRNFIPYDPATTPMTGAGMESFVMVDPARSQNPKSDFTAIVGATVDFNNHLIYFRECLNERFAPDEMVEHAIQMALRLGAYHIGVEYAGLHLHIEKPFHDALARKGLYSLGLVELKPQMGKGEQSGYSEGKVARIIWGLSNWYKWGIVRHHPRNCAVLETQLLAMPRSRKKDVADAASYLVQMLEKLGLHFHAEDLALAQAHQRGSKAIDVFAAPLDALVKHQSSPKEESFWEDFQDLREDGEEPLTLTDLDFLDDTSYLTETYT